MKNLINNSNAAIIMSILFIGGGCGGSEFSAINSGGDSDANIDTMIVSDSAGNDSDGSDGGDGDAANINDTGGDVVAEYDGGGDAIDSAITDTAFTNETNSDVVVIDVLDSAIPDTTNIVDSNVLTDSNPIICTATVCKDKNTQSICNDKGTTILLATCPITAPICNDYNGNISCVECWLDSDCQADYGVCKVGHCNQTTYKCESAKAASGTSCDANLPYMKCNATTGNCQCQTTTMRCSSDSAIEQCKNDGTWQFMASCPNDTKNIGCQSETYGTGSCKTCNTSTTHKANCNLNPKDDCEVDLWHDLNNCGSCGFVCPTGLDCNSGFCSETIVYQDNVSKFEIYKDDVYLLAQSGLMKTNKNLINVKVINAYNGGNFVIDNDFIYTIPTDNHQLNRLSLDGSFSKIVINNVNIDFSVGVRIVNMDYVWNFDMNNLYKIKISDSTYSLAYKFPTSVYHNAVQAENDYIYFTDQISVNKFNKTTSKVDKVIDYPNVSRIVYGDGNVFVSQSGIQDGTIYKINTTSNDSIELIGSYDTGYILYAMTYYNGNLWVSAYKHKTATQIVSLILKVDPINKTWTPMLTRSSIIDELRVDSSGIYWLEKKWLFAIHNINVN